MYQHWLTGLVRTRSGRLVGTIGGVALTVAFIACLGAFLQSSGAEMTARSIAQVPVDWQVQLLSGADPAVVEIGIRSAAPVSALQMVGYADVPGFEANAGGTVQTTGGGTVLGIEPRYFDQFPAQVRRLLGSADGVLVAQQTAANLHVAVGDEVVIHRYQAPDARVTIAGVVDLPNADAVFQAVGLPAGAAPQAPPDNVLLLPMPQWEQEFEPQRANRPDTVRIEFHVKLDHRDLPSDPVEASTAAAEHGHNLEARVAGAALLANNLATRLEAVREDALYAWLIFLFLGAPGVILAVLLTLAVADAGRDKRRREPRRCCVCGARPSTPFFTWPRPRRPWQASAAQYSVFSSALSPLTSCSGWPFSAVQLSPCSVWQQESRFRSQQSCCPPGVTRAGPPFPPPDDRLVRTGRHFGHAATSIWCCWH
ncbi:ABC transporter permease [Mesorhizobium atlanticum]